MFTKLEKTGYPPGDKPLMAWDGNCGFCHYWVLRWRFFTGNAVVYEPFHKVASRFPDIDLKYFKQAVRFIDVDGRIYTGPAAAFRSFQYGDRYHWIFPLYQRWKLVTWVSDHIYSFVSRNRTRMYRITIMLWGRNPLRQKPYWLYYLTGLAAVIAAIIIVPRFLN